MRGRRSFLARAWDAGRRFLSAGAKPSAHSDGACRALPPWEGLAALEPRLLLAATLDAALGDVAASRNAIATSVSLVDHFSDPDIAGTVVRFDTVMGGIYLELFDVASGGRTAAPLTVANFLHHVNGDAIAGSSPTTYYGTYDNTIFHRVVEDFVVQGGGFSFPGFGTPNPGPTVVNEFSATRSNVRGTIAMAKTAAGPDTATNQFFFNLADNSANLDNQNGGFTAFGQVLGTGMTVVDAIAALPTYNGSGINSAFTDLPLRNTPPPQAGLDNVVLLSSVRVVPELIFTVSTDAPTLLNPTVSDGTLLIDYLPNRTGTGHVTVRATDFNGNFVESTFTVTVTAGANPPTVGAVTGPASVTRGQQTLTLTATGVADTGGQVTRVEFFRDSNGNGTFEPGTDEKLGEDTNGANGWSVTANTAGWAPGATRFFARAQDNSGNGSAPVQATVNVLNTAPVLATVDAMGTLDRNQSGTISYELLAAYANESDADGDPLQFRIDAVSSGTLTKNGQPVTPGVTLLGPGELVTWTPATDADGTLNAFTIRAWDGAALSSRPAQVRIIVNKPPVVSSLKVSPVTLLQAGGSITLTASASDADGVVALVEFYRDSNGNGVLDVGTDTKLGEDTSAASGWTLTTSATGAFPAGPIRYFARATDDFYATSAAATVLGVVNAPPTIGSLTTNGPVVRGTGLTLTAADVQDTAPGTVKMVRFYWDLNGNGVIDATDKLLGTGRKQTGTNDWVRTTSTKGYPTGTAKFIAQAVDSNGASATKTTTATVTNAPPTLASLGTRTPVINRGATLALTTKRVKDTDGTIAKAEFYADNNGDGLLDGGDTKIGEDTDIRGGYALAYAVPGNAALGVHHFLARAVDNDGGTSAVAPLAVTFANVNPTLTSLTVAPAAVTQPANLVLTAVGAADADGAGAVSRVRFYQDMNRNRRIDGQDAFLGEDTNGADGFTLTVPSSQVPIVGKIRLMAVAEDADGGSSPVKSVYATVLPAPGVDLVVTALSYAPKAFSLSVDGQKITLRGTVRNQGTEAAGPFSIEAVLVSSADATEYSLGGVDVSGLAAGKNLALRGTIYLDGLAVTPTAGTYFVVLRADTLGDVDETNELNNDLASPLADVVLVA